MHVFVGGYPWALVRGQVREHPEAAIIFCLRYQGWELCNDRELLLDEVENFRHTMSLAEAWIVSDADAFQLPFSHEPGARLWTEIAEHVQCLTIRNSELCAAHTYLYIHTHTQTGRERERDTHTHTLLLTYLPTYLPTYTHTHIPHTRAHTHPYTHTHLFTHPHTHIHLHLHMAPHAYTHTSTPTPTPTRLHPRLHLHLHLHLRTYRLTTYLPAYSTSHPPTYLHTSTSPVSIVLCHARGKNLPTYLPTYIHTYIHTYIRFCL